MNVVGGTSQDLNTTTALDPMAHMRKLKVVMKDMVTIDPELFLRLEASMQTPCLESSWARPSVRSGMGGLRPAVGFLP